MSKLRAGDRWSLTTCQSKDETAVLLAEIRSGLSERPKRLPCRYIYDEVGSKLFEEISDLPEYYLTRTERSILSASAGEIIDAVPGVSSLVELGSGNASKTCLVIEALLAQQDGLIFTPIDISPSALEASGTELLSRYPKLQMAAIAGEYEAGIALLHQRNDERHLVLWLGSSIGNLTRQQAADFLARLKRSLSQGDRLLVGVDLRKEPAILQRAYNDSQGITARFNLNLLARINRELRGEFDPSDFDFCAIYREEEGVVQSYLVSRRAHTVRIGALALDAHFEADERIHTENSYKYSPEEFEGLALQAGLRPQGSWEDPDERFSLVLLAAD